MRALLVCAVAIAIVAAHSENSKLQEDVKKTVPNPNENVEVDHIQAEGSSVPKNVVTIKKDKNYEILLYEYEDDVSEENQSSERTKVIKGHSEPLVPRSGVPLVWNPQKLNRSGTSATTTTTTTTSTTTTTTRKPTTTTTTTTTTPKPTSTRRPRTTTQANESPEYDEDFDTDDALNQVNLRPLVRPQEVPTTRPFNPLRSNSTPEKPKNEEKSTTPKISENVVEDKLANKETEDDSEEVSIPKVKVHKRKERKDSKSRFPQPPENIFAPSFGFSSEEVAINSKILQTKLSSTHHPTESSDEIFFSTTEKTSKSKVKVFTGDSPNPNGGIFNIEETNPSAVKPGKDSSSSNSEEDVVVVHNPKKPNEESDDNDDYEVKQLKKPYDTPRIKPTSKPPQYGRPQIHSDKSNSGRKHHNHGATKGYEEDNDSHSFSDEKVFPNSRRPRPEVEKPIHRPEDVPHRNKGSNGYNKGSQGFVPPEEVVPHRSKGSNGYSKGSKGFQPPEEVIPHKNKGSNGYNKGSSGFQPPEEVVPHKSKGSRRPDSPKRRKSHRHHNKGSHHSHPPSEVNPEFVDFHPEVSDNNYNRFHNSQPPVDISIINHPGYGPSQPPPEVPKFNGYGGFTPPSEVVPINSAYGGFKPPSEVSPINSAYGHFQPPQEVKEAPKQGYGGFNPPQIKYGGFKPPAEVNPHDGHFVPPSEVNPHDRHFIPPSEVNPHDRHFVPPSEVNPHDRHFAPPSQVNPYGNKFIPPSEVNPDDGHFVPPSEVDPDDGDFVPPAEVDPDDGDFVPPSEVKPKKHHFHPPSEVNPKKHHFKPQSEVSEFVPPSEVPSKKLSKHKFRPPAEVSESEINKGKHFIPPSEVPSKKLPDSPRFPPNKRPKPSGQVDLIDPSEVEYSLESDSNENNDESLICKDPTGNQGICQEYYKCSILYSNFAGKIDLQEYKCPLPTQVGICCPIIQQNEKSKKLMKMVSAKDMPFSSHVSRLIRNNLPSSFAFGDQFVDEMEEIERELLARSVTVKRNTPAFGHHKFFPTSKKIRDVSNIGFSLLQTSNDLSERLQLTNEIGGIGLKSFKSSNLEALTDRCPSEPFCPRLKYRTIDGSCNNLAKPKLGQSLTPLSRVLSPAYADGRWEPRRSVRGFDLPTARLLSQQFIPDHDVPNKRFTLFTMQFGQFIDHDISSVPMFTFGNNSGIDCCQNGQFLPSHLRHPNCFPIEIPADDPFYGPHGQRCMNLVRSRMAPRIDCSLGYADQMNALTHWLDASNVYGSTLDEARELRAFNGGMLRFSTVPGSKLWLPLKPTNNNDEIDYKAGDDRVNEMQGLMISHLVWFREHNRLAEELSRVNRHWNDEQLFHESRRILIAQYQHIIYNEWLPIIIGRDYMDTYGILPLTRDYFKAYDSDVDASVENSFSSAAFRMGHTLVQGVVHLVNQFGQGEEAAVISRHSENAVRTHAAGQVDKWIRGLILQPIQNYDPFISQHLNGKLFSGRNSAFGMDLSSLNIQRGRDHGVPGYNAYRELCQTGKKAKSFDDFGDWIPREMIEKMRRFYVDVDDVDLWIGGLSETPLPGALVGPTFTCIIGDQFARSKKGDRYFYDVGDEPHSFSRAQLDEIRKASFSRILCDNSDDLDLIQPLAFLLPDNDFNELQDCRRSNRIPRVDLGKWFNEPTP